MTIRDTSASAKFRTKDAVKKRMVSIHNSKNKQHLLNLFVTYLCADDFAKSSLLPTLANNENDILKISSSVTKVFEYIREEDDRQI